MFHINRVNENVEKLFIEIDQDEFFEKYDKNENFKKVIQDTIKNNLLPHFIYTPFLTHISINSKINSSDFYVDIFSCHDEYYFIEILDTRNPGYQHHWFNSEYYKCDGDIGLIDFLKNHRIIK